MRKDISLYIVPVLIYIFFFSPFFLPNDLFDQFQTGPVIFIIILTGGTFCYQGFRLFSNNSRFEKKISLKPNRMDIVILISFGYIIIQTFFLKQHFVNEKLITHCCLIGVYFIVRNFVSASTDTGIKLLALPCLIGTLGALLLNDCFGLFQYYGVIASNSHYFLVTGPFFNPGHFANYLACLYPVSFITFFRYPKGAKHYGLIKFVALSICLSTSIILYILNIRAVWLGVILSSSIFLLENFLVQVRKRISKCLIGFVAIVSICIVSGLFYQIRPNSADGRLTVWKVTARIIKEHPFFGVGYGNFEYVYDNYQSDYFSRNRSENNEALNADIIKHPYNEFLHILSEQGLIGLIFFIYLFWCVLQAYKKIKGQTEQPLPFALTISFYGILTILVAGVFSYPFDIPTVLFFFFFYLGIIAGIYTRQLPALETKTISIIGSTKGLGSIVMVLVSFSLFYYGVMKFYAFKYCQSAYLLHKNALNEYYYPYARDNPKYLVLVGKYLFERQQYQRVIYILENEKAMLNIPEEYILLGLSYSKINDLGLAEKNLLIAENMVPNRYYTKVVLFKFYIQTNELNKAKVLSNWILHSVPKIPSKEVEAIKAQVKIMTEMYY